MKICFVYPDIDGTERYGARKFYHGLGYISAVLKRAGHETTLIYLQREPTAESFVSEVEAQSPDILAFSSTTHQHRFVERCAGWAKAAQPERLIVSGGVHPTLVPEEVLANPAIDVVCVGEGEDALLDLVHALEGGKSIAHIPNLWVRDQDSGQVSYNPLRPLLTNLDQLPFADRELFDYADILARNGGVADLVAGRGCPYNCSYCCNHALRARYRGLGKYVRFRGVSNVLAEIRELRSRYAITVLNFQDDAFTLDRHWALEFCRAYGAEFSLPFWVNSRVEQLDEELIQALAQAGCQLVRIGVESGNEQLRREVLKRHMSNDDFRRVFRLLRQYGIQSYSCNMIGLPGETPEMLQETIDLNRDLDPDKFQFSVFYPYPMTELHDISVREGHLRADQDLTGYYGRESVLQLPTISAAELGEGYDRFEELGYELALKHRSSWRYRLYRLLYKLYGGNVIKMRRHRGQVRGWVGALRHGRSGTAGASK